MFFSKNSDTKAYPLGWDFPVITPRRVIDYITIISPDLGKASFQQQQNTLLVVYPS